MNDDLMKEKTCVYETLRNEIISTQEQQRNVWIYMYVLFCTLFVLGLQWSKYLFLVTYIVLIPFQCIINDYLWSVSKISTYIRVFFEDDIYNGIHWECFHLYSPYRRYYSEKVKSITGVLEITGSIHLGILSTGSFCIFMLKDAWYTGGYNISQIDFMLICLSLILLFILFAICKDYNKKHHYSLESIMREYKKNIENQILENKNGSDSK